jgi:hypothetical protein
MALVRLRNSSLRGSVYILDYIYKCAASLQIFIIMLVNSMSSRLTNECHNELIVKFRPCTELCCWQVWGLTVVEPWLLTAGFVNML